MVASMDSDSVNHHRPRKVPWSLAGHVDTPPPIIFPVTVSSADGISVAHITLPKLGH
jgi:hypothetical protein